ncbi:hypothetical protein [Brachybacterium subflavum]|uniref:hypothetical protein n=1 Tax=Brachybacterium subflavum TaxID=2585206 RepID=UPI0012666A01|nr:hypothetical protein [Brachybacterium subflavum]
MVTALVYAFGIFPIVGAVIAMAIVAAVELRSLVVRRLRARRKGVHPADWGSNRRRRAGGVNERGPGRGSASRQEREGVRPSTCLLGGRNEHDVHEVLSAELDAGRVDLGTQSAERSRVDLGCAREVDANGCAGIERPGSLDVLGEDGRGIGIE